MPIQVLPDPLVSQIAAGEVVERPASVVKELLENALDAGASHIHVTIDRGGRKLIRVSDDGTGIPAAEVKLAFARHATSKLQTVDDLQAIMTLGFRGEALASIASVSRISMTTRYRGEPAGTTIRVEGGNLLKHEPAGSPAGTIISVENLFYNTPARLKFLKKESTEKRHIVTLVMRYAMAYPQVRFSLEQDGREAFRSSGSGQLIDVLAHVLGLDGVRDLLPVELAAAATDVAPAVNVSGFTSTPSLSRSERSHIALFINGRWILDSNLTYAVVQSYQGLLKPGRYPVAVLMIGMSPQDVDVNVHPTKAEVRFRNPGAVFAAVQRAVRRVLVDSQRPDLHGSPSHSFEAPVQKSYWESQPHTPAFGIDSNKDDRVTKRRQRADEDDLTHFPEGPGGPARPRTLPVLRVVGQVGAMYIVTEGPAGMYLVDQHSAHQRVLYEELMEAYALGAGVPQQGVTVPYTVDMSASEAQTVEQHLDLLAALGFNVEPFGPTTFAIRAVPVILKQAEPDAVLRGMAEILASKRSDTGGLEDRLITYICGCAAYKAGQILSPDDMQALVRRLERCQSPMVSPEGATTIVHMSGDQLAREFSRRV